MMNNFDDLCKNLQRPLRHDALTVNRRKFLQFTALGAGATAAAGFLSAPGVMAGPLGVTAGNPTDGIVVLVGLRGGIDGLNVLTPIDQGRYRDLRPRLSLDPAAVHRIGGGLAFHPSLARLKRRYDAGQVAAIQGIGMPVPNLSHFESTERWMLGTPDSDFRTGWLGRWMDGSSGLGDLAGISLGNGASLQMAGAKRQGVSIPANGNLGFFAKTKVEDVMLQQGLHNFGDASTGLGVRGDELAAAGRRAVDTAAQIKGVYDKNSAGSGFARMMAVAARMVSAGVGVRVLDVEFGSFDTHSGQDWVLNDMLQDLDEGIERFFAELDPMIASRVTMVLTSEFGRRPKENGSAGTDHGTANCAFVIGSKVRGGLHGAYPSLSKLDNRGNLVASVDFRSLYATVLDRWLRGDSREILGANYEQLNLFIGSPGNADITRKAPRPGARDGYVIVTSGGAVHNFGNADSYGGTSANNVVGVASHPTGDGYWIATDDGGVEAFGKAGHFGSMRSFGLNKPVVDIEPSPSGAGYWMLGADGGVFSFGDAAFYGSTGAISLNRPVVGMASHPKKGYWFVASDGGVFTYGPNADFYGSTGGIRLNSPIVSIARTASGKGYWLVAADGGVFAFGDAPFYGSAGSLRLASPITALARTVTGKGYWLVAADGGIFSYGDAEFEGSVGGTGQRVAGFATT